MSDDYTSAKKLQVGRGTGIEDLYRQVRQANTITNDLVHPFPNPPDGARMHFHCPGIAMVPVRTPTLPPATHTNCYVIGTDEIVVIDPASPYSEEQAALDQALTERQAEGCRVVAIWLTHHHLDHVQGVAHLAQRLGVPVSAHAETAARVDGLVAVDRNLDDGDSLSLAGDPPRRVRAVFTPGHAPGHLCFVEEHTGAMVAGDMVAGLGTILVAPPEGNMREYLQSLDRMKSLAPTALLPAHGPIISDATAKIDAYIRHRLWREERVHQALTQVRSATAKDLVLTVYNDVPDTMHLVAERSLLAHLLKLADDGRAECDGDRWRAC